MAKTHFSANECLTHTDTDWKSFDQTRMQCHPTYIMLEVPRCAFEIANFPFAGVTVGDKPSIWPEIPDDHEYRQCKGYVIISWIQNPERFIKMDQKSRLSNLGANCYV